MGKTVKQLIEEFLVDFDGKYKEDKKMEIERLDTSLGDIFGDNDYNRYRTAFFKITTKVDSNKTGIIKRVFDTELKTEEIEIMLPLTNNPVEFHIFPLIKIHNLTSNKQGLFNYEKQEYLIPEKYDNLDFFYSGPFDSCEVRSIKDMVIAIATLNGKKGIIGFNFKKMEKKSSILVPIKFDEIKIENTRSHENFVSVKKDQKWGAYIFIKETNSLYNPGEDRVFKLASIRKYVIPCVFEEIRLDSKIVKDEQNSPMEEDGSYTYEREKELRFLVKKNNLWGVYSHRKKKMIIEAAYDENIAKMSNTFDIYRTFKDGVRYIIVDGEEYQEVK